MAHAFTFFRVPNVFTFTFQPLLLLLLHCSLGAKHDFVQNECSEGYIMNAIKGSIGNLEDSLFAFSQCSIEEMKNTTMGFDGSVRHYSMYDMIHLFIVTVYKQ